MVSETPNNTTPVLVWSFDEGFVEPAIASIHSALSGIRGDLLATVVVVGREIGNKFQSRLQNWLRRRHPHVEYLWIDGSSHKLPRSAAHYSDAMFLRLLLPDLLPQFQRAVYTDADTNVVGDLGDLWHEPLDGYPVGAVRDQKVPIVSSPCGLRMWERLGLKNDIAYVNSGVLLMDLCQWRDVNASDAAMRFAETYGGELRFPDQDILNGVFAGRIKILPARYNLTSWKLPSGEPGPIVIRHFAGPIKPWNGGITVPGVWLYYSTLWDAGWRITAVRGLIGRIGCTLRRAVTIHLLKLFQPAAGNPIRS